MYRKLNEKQAALLRAYAELERDVSGTVKGMRTTGDAAEKTERSKGVWLSWIVYLTLRGC